MNVPFLLAAADRLTFAEPRLFALAGLIPVLVLLRALGSRRKERGLQRIVAPGLRPKLVVGESPRRDRTLFVVELIALSLVIAALARPQFGETEREARSEGRNLIVGIDTSRSMLAADLEPNRLTRAKLAASDLIRELPNDRIGIMAFAGNAVLQVPLTIDHTAIGETLEQLDIYSIEKGGSDIGAAIDLAIEHFGKIAADKNALILFTDGEDLAGKGLDAAEKAAEEGILIITVGVGSTLGSIVPDAGTNDDGQFIRNRSGELVKSRLDVDSLEKIATRTHGMFINLNARSMNADLVENMLAQLDTTRDERTARTVPVERYQWPLGAGTLLLAITFLLPAFRRARSFFPGSVPAHAACLLIGALVLAPSAARATSAEAAWEAYNDANYTDAVELYGQAIEDSRSEQKRARLEFGRGAAAYRAGDLDTALDAYSRSLLAADVALREQSHFNIGNTLFRRGERALKPKEGEQMPAPESVDPVLADWQDAVQHYEDTLALNPSNESAKRNAEIVRQRIDQLKEEQQKQEEEQKQQEQKKDDEQKKDEPKDQDKQDEKKEEKKDQQQEEKKDGDEEKSDEGQPKEDEEQKEGEKEGEEKQDEGKGQQPQEDPEGKDGEKSESPSQSSEEGEKSEDKNAGQGDPKDGSEKPSAEEKEASLSEDEKINPETGYSKMDAERILRMLSDEQLDMKPLRRRVRIPNIDDW